jgi:hypothetical protein
MTTRNWLPHPTNPLYLVKFGVKDGLVRTQPSGDKGYLWQCGKTYGFSPTVEEAKEMVEGVALLLLPKGIKP